MPQLAVRIRSGLALPGFATFLSIATLLSIATPPRAAHAQGTFTAEEAAVVVEVPVQVIRDGEPVRGLTAADFELYDGRKRVPIVGFEVVDLTTETAAPAQVASPGRRHFLLVFDLTFSDPTAVVKARQAAGELLDELHLSDLVGVATFSAAQGAQLVLGFTSDRGQARAAIDNLGLPELLAGRTDPLRLVLTDPSAAPPSQATDGSGGGGRAAESREERLTEVLQSVSLITSRAERSVERLMVRAMTDSFTELARVMGEIDGRKYVVLLSEGFDSSLVSGSGGGAAGQNDMQALVDAAGDTDPLAGGGGGSDESFGDTRTQNAVERMLTEFRRADCQIQAVDIGGLRALAAEGRQRANGRESLLTLAKDTGGDLYENTNDLGGAMGQMLRRTTVTYVLAFQPQDIKADGAFRKLRVEVKGAARGTRLVHRVGYYAPRPYGEQPALQRVLETASAVMGEPGGALAAAVLTAPFAAGSGNAYVPVLVELGGPSLLAGLEGAALPVEIYVYAMDASGAVRDFLSQTIGLDLAKAKDQLRQSGLKFFGHLELPAGAYTVRVLVRNAATGAYGLRVEELVVPAFVSGEATLLPALFPEPVGRWLMARETPRPGEAQAPYPFMSQGQPYIPASLPVLAPGEKSALVLQGFNLAGGEVKARAEVLAADGKAMPGGALDVTGAEGGGAQPLRVRAQFQPPALSPGEYVLRVTLTAGDGTTQTSNARFAVAARGR